jgi:KTSC domain
MTSKTRRNLVSDIEWIDVSDSKRIVAMAYDEAGEAILVRFAKDEVEWCYEGCPLHVWEEFSDPAQSKGSYIHEILNHKPHHRYE